MKKKSLSPLEREDLIDTLRGRFEENVARHEGIEWKKVEAKLRAEPTKLWSLHQMEETGGEPDVVGFDKKSSEFLFYDCSPESPKGRRSTSFDPAAIESRKEHKPNHSAVGMAKEMGIQLLTEDEYRELQKLDEFDLKTSSWVATPTEIRKLGGAVFCDRRYDAIWTYHNGAESYYGSRGFRGSLRV